MQNFRLETVIDGPLIRKTGSRVSTTVFSALSIAADEVPFDPRQLLGFLHFRLDTAMKAQKRSAWVGGRLYNALTGQSATYIPLSGSHLRQVLSSIGLQAPERVAVQGRYELRLDYALKAYRALNSKVEALSK